MGDAQQAPVIQLDIDQELFIDTVRAGDSVEDATVSTEVTALSPVGETYLLEGAIVFAGALRHSGPPADATDAHAVVPVQQRVPFRLRVPAKTQPRGIVNVASRISAWKLNVVGDNWIQMEADLQISGLNGKHGFHFQCGATEYGELLRDGELPPAVDAPAVIDAPITQMAADEGAAIAAAQQEDELADILLQQPSTFDPASDLESDEPTLEFFPAQLEDVRTATYQDDFELRRELLELDRAMDGDAALLRSSAQETGENPSDADIVLEEPDTEAVANAPATEPNPEPAYTTFEFEHQVAPDDAAPSASVIAAQPPLDIPFSAARSFAEDRFSPHSGFSDVVRVARDDGAASGTMTAPAVETPDTAAGETVAAPRSDSSTLWSFVDFNQPERSYTLRYVVVMEDDTLSTVAERAGCKVAELMSVNQISGDEVYIGQTLRIPSPVVSFGARS